MKAIWVIQEDNGDVVGTITIDGNWSTRRFRKNFMLFVTNMCKFVKEGAEIDEC